MELLTTPPRVNRGQQGAALSWCLALSCVVLSCLVWSCLVLFFLRPSVFFFLLRSVFFFFVVLFAFFFISFGFVNGSVV